MSSRVTVIRIEDGWVIRGPFRMPSCCTGQGYTLQGLEMTCGHSRQVSWWSSIMPR